MIGKLIGQVDSIFEDNALINVQGVCYIVFLSTYILGQLAPISTAD